MKECKIPECSVLPNLTGCKIVVGLKQLRKALLKGLVRDVYLAKDADPAITEPALELSLQCGARVSWCASMADLGKACGIDVKASAAAVLDMSGSNG